MHDPRMVECTQQDKSPDPSTGLESHPSNSGANQQSAEEREGPGNHAEAREVGHYDLVGPPGGSEDQKHEEPLHEKVPTEIRLRDPEGPRGGLEGVNVQRLWTARVLAQDLSPEKIPVLGLHNTVIP